MDPVWATVTEWWWVGPAVLGGGMATWLGVRQSRIAQSRRLGLEAAKLRLAEARRHHVTVRAMTRVKRAELTRVQAERTASKATHAQVAAAKRDLAAVQADLKAAAANIRSQRAQVAAARAMLPLAAQQSPLERLVAEHDALTARWLEYETDPAKLIAFPALSDMRVPETAAFVVAQQHALHQRPASDKKRVTTAEFAAYRDAVMDASRAFEIAETAAWRTANGLPPERGDASPAWSAAAESVIRRSAEMLGRAADTMIASMREATEATRDASAHARDAFADDGRGASMPPADPTPPRAARPEPPRTADPEPPRAARPEPPASTPAHPRIWPVPSRDSRDR